LEISKQFEHPFILVTGDCDETAPAECFERPNDFQDFIHSDKLVHWFSQNCIIINHPKLSQIPIGMDYHTLAGDNPHEWGNKISPIDQEKLLNVIKTKADPFWKRKIMAYSNFHFSMTTKYAYDRIDAKREIPDYLVYYEPEKIKRLNSWAKQSEYAFVVSPHGNGLDCHRTWEALNLGCIPIVKTSPLDPLYQDLPVLIVQSWSDVTLPLLNKTVRKFKKKNFNYDKLKLAYWINHINEKALPSLSSPLP